MSMNIIFTYYLIVILSHWPPMSSLSYIRTYYHAIGCNSMLASVILSSCLAIQRLSQMSTTFQPARISPSVSCGKHLKMARAVDFILQRQSLHWLYFREKLICNFVGWERRLTAVYTLVCRSAWALFVAKPIQTLTHKLKVDSMSLNLD
jgi:hypothetical protein